MNHTFTLQKKFEGSSWFNNEEKFALQVVYQHKIPFFFVLLIIYLIYHKIQESHIGRRRSGGDNFFGCSDSKIFLSFQITTKE